METNLLKVVGQIAGIGGISLGVFLLLFRDIIQKKIFPQLTKQQAFRLLILLSILIWSVALAGIGAWVWSNSSSGSTNIKQQVSGNGTAIINTGSGGVINTSSGDVSIGITLEKYENGLKRKEKEVAGRLTKAHSKEKEFLQAQLDTIKQQLLNSKSSYKEHIQDLRERITQLESIRGQVPDKLLDQAQSALAQGDTSEAEKLFKEVERLSQGAIRATAEAQYQRCKIEEDNINYREAFPLCKRAVQLVPENTTYLFAAGSLSDTLGHYAEAIDYYELALSCFEKKLGPDHPSTKIVSQNLLSARTSEKQKSTVDESK